MPESGGESRRASGDLRKVCGGKVEKKEEGRAKIKSGGGGAGWWGGSGGEGPFSTWRIGYAVQKRLEGVKENDPTGPTLREKEAPTVSMTQQRGKNDSFS